MTIHSGSNILIVDDSATVRSIVRKLLTQLGYKHIDEASDGAAALEKLLNHHCDLVISDWNMEPVGGKELLEQVRASEKHKHLHFIMMTADPTIDKIVQAKDARVSCFISKPFRAEALQAKILEMSHEP
jgi:two-component system chemotaxis response regulator CheY